MARIVYTLGELMGSVGGLTFQRNSSGTIVRTRPIPTKRTTTRQSATHTAHIHWLYEWQQLTQAQRDDWNTYASTWQKINKFGQSKTLTGQNWFETSNYYRTNIGETQLSNPPVHTLPQDPPTFDIYLSETAIRICATEAHDYINNPVILWVSPPTRRNTPTINQTRRLATILIVEPACGYDITTFWETAIGIPWTPSTLFPNANIFVCLQSIRRSSGITSALLCEKADTESGIGSNLETDTGDNLQTDTGDYIQPD